MGLFAGFAFEQVQEAEVREGIVGLLNLVEEQHARVQALEAEVERLRAENRRLKGETKKPVVRAKSVAGSVDVSSEAERHEPREWHKGSKRATLRIDRAEVCRVDPALLPPDAEFKGYAEVIVQDVVVRPDVICFRKELWYSPSQGRTYRAELPAGYSGEFGPTLKGLVLVLAYAGQMSEAKILEVLGGIGLPVSAGTLSNWLIKETGEFTAEQAAVYEAGLRHGAYQHYDDTTTRVKGALWWCHIVDNPLMTAYFTRPGKDRLTVIEVLRGDAEPTYRVNAEALSYLTEFGLPAKVLTALATFPTADVVGEADLTAWLTEHLPGLGPRQATAVREATALAAYSSDPDWPVLRALLTDDAPQFKGIAEIHALCWVHEGRLFKKLSPYLARHQEILTRFLTRFWEYYRELRAYREQPTPADRRRLRQRFDRLFATTTGYRALDDRIALTRAKKTALLQVLGQPELPLHNNPAELGARRRVRKRDVSFQPGGPDGAQAWDTFQSLVATTQKLGVRFWDYILDRLTGAGLIPPLADILTDRALARDSSLALS